MEGLCFARGEIDPHDQFIIYHRMHSAKRPETRQKRLAELLEKLARGEGP